MWNFKVNSLYIQYQKNIKCIQQEKFKLISSNFYLITISKDLLNKMINLMSNKNFKSFLAYFIILKRL